MKFLLSVTVSEMIDIEVVVYDLKLKYSSRFWESTMHGGWSLVAYVSRRTKIFNVIMYISVFYTPMPCIRINSIPQRLLRPLRFWIQKSIKPANVFQWDNALVNHNPIKIILANIPLIELSKPSRQNRFKFLDE